MDRNPKHGRYRHTASIPTCSSQGDEVGQTQFHDVLRQAPGNHTKHNRQLTLTTTIVAAVAGMFAVLDADTGVVIHG